ncbi:ubiquitin-like protein 7 [Styela clava]
MENSFKLHVSYIDNENIHRSEQIVLDVQSPIYKQFREKINSTFGLSSDDYELYFGLKRLDCNPDQEMKEWGLQSGNRLHAIRKKLPSTKQDVPKIDYAKVQNASYGLATMIQHENRSHKKSALTKLFEDKKTIDKIISNISGLREDRAAMDILQNAKLFKVIVNPKYLKNIVEKHPCLAIAFEAMWNTLMTSSKYSNTAASTSSTVSMDVDAGQSNESHPSSSNQASNMITLSQLSAAIAQATPPSEGYNFPYSAFNTPNSNTTSNTSTTPQERNETRPQQLTPEALNQAMQEALMSTGLREVSQSLQSESSAPRSNDSVLSEDVMRAGLEQLHSMGITDDEASRHALTATQGNVEAAINILFSGN